MINIKQEIFHISVVHLFLDISVTHPKIYNLPFVSMLNWNEVSFCKRGKIINFRKKILRVRTKPMCKTQPTCDVWFKSQTIKLVVEGKSSLQYATSITPTDYWQSADCWPTVGGLSVEGSCSLPLPKVLVDSVSVHDDCIKIIQHNTWNAVFQL